MDLSQEKQNKRREPNQNHRKNPGNHRNPKNLQENPLITRTTPKNLRKPSKTPEIPTNNTWKSKRQQKTSENHYAMQSKQTRMRQIGKWLKSMLVSFRPLACPKTLAWTSIAYASTAIFPCGDRQALGRPLRRWVNSLRIAPDNAFQFDQLINLMVGDDEVWLMRCRWRVAEIRRPPI